MAQNVARVLPQQGRVLRRPQHPFQIRTRPWLLQPFFIAPVLPGETMENCLIQFRSVTDPIKSPLVGWWAEYYLFYVRHRDLQKQGADSTVLQAMMLDPSASVNSIADNTGTAAYPFYKGTADTVGDPINFTLKVYDAIVKTYFRDEVEGSASPTVSNVSIAKISGPAGPRGNNWLDSVMNAADMPASYSADVDSADANTTIQTNEMIDALRKWEYFRDMGLTDMSYDDYLATYGVKPSVPDVDLKQPELLRYGREWNYPTAIVNPATGTPSNAVHWSMTARADKPRFFREPGFLMGIMTYRPKVYLRKQTNTLTSWLNNAYAWLPAVLDDPQTSMRQFATGKGPLPVLTDANGYWVDVKDLYLYGEQFINFDPAAVTDASFVDLPTATNGKEYPATTDMDALFTSASPANQIRCDGLVSLSIAGRQRDTSAKVSG